MEKGESRMSSGSYQDLAVWQKAMVFAKDVYIITKCYPNSELYGLTSQIRRGAVSIPGNIAEGWGRKSKGDFIRFLAVARGSAAELETEILLSSEIGILSKDQSEPVLQNLTEIRKMLNALIKSLKAKSLIPES